MTMATSEKLYNSDGTRRSCPHGASVDYPVGTVHHVKVCDIICTNCPCFGSPDIKKYHSGNFSSIICHYPNFAPQYDYANH